MLTATFNTSSITTAPMPVESSLSPSSANVGAPGLMLTVNGSGFVSSSVVRWNGADRATTFVSASQRRRRHQHVGPRRCGRGAGWRVHARAWRRHVRDSAVHRDPSGRERR